MFDPLTEAHFLLWTIAWWLWCTCLAWEASSLDGFAADKGGWGLVALCGPCVWAVALHRWFHRACHAVKRRFGVENLGCQCGRSGGHH